MRRPVEPPAPALAFRRATIADVDRVVEIEREGFLHPWARDLIERALGHVWSQLLVAEERAGGAIVG